MIDDERLNDIYDSTAGRCHLCGKKVAYRNYGVLGARGAWEVDHSNPRARGGTDRLNNLKPACIRCNRSKQHGSTRAFRAAYGRTRAPMSVKKRAEARRNNAITAAIGAGLGAVALGAAGPLAWTAAVAGAWLAHRTDPERSQRD